MWNVKQVNSLSVVFALFLLTGCGTNNSNNTTPIQGAHAIYVVQNGILSGAATDSVLEFSATANGSVSPTATLTGPAGVEFTSVAVDKSGNLYVGSNSPTPEILVYPAGATGSATPMRAIDGSNTGLASVNALAVDPSGAIYVTNGTRGTVLVFAAGATGNVAPARTITSPSMSSPYSIAVNSSNVYVSQPSSGGVFVFPSSANGSTNPAQMIEGANTDLTASFGVGLDPAGNIYATNDSPGWEIIEFSPTANGNVTPMRAISGSVAIAGVAVDAAGTIYVVTDNLTTFRLAIEVFASGSNSSSAPTATISSSAWTICNMGQIAIQ